MRTRHLPLGFCCRDVLGHSRSWSWVNKLYINSLLYCMWTFLSAISVSVKLSGGRWWDLLPSPLVYPRKGEQCGRFFFFFFLRQGHLEIGATKQPHKQPPRREPCSSGLCLSCLCLSQHCGRWHNKESLLAIDVAFNVSSKANGDSKSIKYSKNVVLMKQIQQLSYYCKNPDIVVRSGLVSLWCLFCDNVRLTVLYPACLSDREGTQGNQWPFFFFF